MHRIVRTSLSVVSAAVLLVGSVGASHAVQCSGIGPVTARPISGGGAFSIRIPSNPVLTTSEHWVFVDDWDDLGITNGENSGNIRTGFINNENGGVTRSETLSVLVDNLTSGEQFASCSIKAMMLANNASNAGTAYLFVKSGATQSDGSAITVGPAFLQEYERAMTTNPITGVAWTTDDLINGIQIGIKNPSTTGLGNGVGYSSIVLSCQ